MIVFEARNSYELLISFILGKRLMALNSEQQVLILLVNLIPSLNYQEIEACGISTLAVTAPRGLLTLQLLFSVLRSRVIRIKNVQRIFVFHEISPFSLLQFFGKEVNILEHGEINYINIFDAYSKFSFWHPYLLMKRLLGQSFVGEGMLFTHVYLKDPGAAPKRICAKVLPLDIVDYYDSMAPSDKQALSALFLCDLTGISSHVAARVVVTQPFSELNMMTEDRKIDMYRSIMRSGSDDTYIKPHPRETTDYSVVFPDAVILDKKVPFELFWLSGLRNSRIYTVNSSVGRIRGMKVVYLGESFLNEYQGN